MTTGEIIKELITAKDYVKVRMTVSDEFIEFVKQMLPSDYEYFEEKENEYNAMIKK
jgi:predicted RNA-binding protein YlqC (UPF0109 family)